MTTAKSPTAARGAALRETAAVSRRPAEWLEELSRWDVPLEKSGAAFVARAVPPIIAQWAAGIPPRADRREDQRARRGAIEEIFCRGSGAVSAR